MAKPPAPVQPLQGMAEMQFLFEVLRDEDLLAQVMADIQTRTDTANGIIALIGPAQEIEAMNARARISEQEAAARLAAAGVEADRLVAAGQAKADEMIAAAGELEAAVKERQAEVDATVAEAVAAIAKASAATAGVEQREREVVKAMAQAEALTAQAEAAKALYDGKLAEHREMLKRLAG